MSSQNILDQILNRYDEDTFQTADGFDEAVIGVDTISMRLVYSVKKAIEILSRQMTEEEAREYFDFNVGCAMVGDKTPIWCEDDF